jgi:uncharacterized protein
MTLGLMWQCALSLWLVRREMGVLTWATLRTRFRLNAPRDPQTGMPRKRLWLWLLVFLGVLLVFEFGVNPVINKLWISLFPLLAEPRAYSVAEFLGSPANRAQLVGTWWMLGITALLAVFDTFLGEEFLFHGILLPKLGERFGAAAWIVSGFLFGLYHMHQPWGIPGNILSTSVFAFATLRFRSTWFSIILHSGQSILLLFMILALILGIAN